MASFFKTFGMGVLYIVTLPLTLAYWALYAVYCAIIFVIMFIKNIIIFFSGGTVNGDMKEDVEAKRILAARKDQQIALQNVYLSMAQNGTLNIPQPNQNPNFPNVNPTPIYPQPNQTPIYPQPNQTPIYPQPNPTPVYPQPNPTPVNPEINPAPVNPEQAPVNNTPNEASRFEQPDISPTNSVEDDEGNKDDDID